MGHFTMIAELSCLRKRSTGPARLFYMLLSLCCIYWASCGCAAKTDCSGDPCDEAKSICREAREMGAEYDTLPDEEKHEMSSAVNTYNDHCEEALQRCEHCKAK